MAPGSYAFEALPGTLVVQEEEIGTKDPHPEEPGVHRDVGEGLPLAQEEPEPDLQAT